MLCIAVTPLEKFSYSSMRPGNGNHLRLGADERDASEYVDFPVRFGEGLNFGCALGVQILSRDLRPSNYPGRSGDRASSANMPRYQSGSPCRRRRYGRQYAEPALTMHSSLRPSEGMPAPMGRTEFPIDTRPSARRREIAENVADYLFAAAPRSRLASTIGAMSAAARISTPPARTRGCFDINWMAWFKSRASST